ncbi:collectin-11 [Plakobranchus ocellatus]|uniref:Collectin-11 n=1 Tax=Plakobranchus ocellatus TaxID=259542 RepID=A0AAV4A724_9GAST|nr:collectin-11 [Plakobranchus ocellatus]
MCSSLRFQGATKFLKPYQDKCYKFYVQPRSKRQYWEAQRECKKNKGNLAMPKTEEMNKFLADSLLQYGEKEEVFIGLDDMERERQFKWKDGSELMKPKFYENFNKGTGIFRKRGGQNRDCVTLDPLSNKWQDIDCRRNIIQRLTGYRKAKSFVCEYGDDNDKDKDVPDSTRSTTNDPGNNKQTGDGSSFANSTAINKDEKHITSPPFANDDNKQNDSFNEEPYNRGILDNFPRPPTPEEPTWMKVFRWTLLLILAASQLYTRMIFHH